MSFWLESIDKLKQKIPIAEFNMWIRPLQALVDDLDKISLLAPNQFVVNKFKEDYLASLVDILNDLSQGKPPILNIEIGSITKKKYIEEKRNTELQQKKEIQNKVEVKANLNNFSSNLNKNYTFNNFVEGKSNQLALSVAIQISKDIGGAYNPFYLYGGTGLGKTHLIHAIANQIIENNPRAKIKYLHSEKFVHSMVRAIQNKEIEQFKKLYRGLDVLLIDDIQFFAKKERTQEEFFHTFNVLLEGKHQVILTSDRYPKEIEGVEERLKSRFSWGLSIAIEPADLETRVAILMKKSSEQKVLLSADIAFFIAQKINSNIRELEGALNKVIALANFKSSLIDIDLAKEALKDLILLQEKMVTLDNIKKMVCGFYNIESKVLLSKKRNRYIVRPRQIAMSLSKELTTKSLPEIGNFFGGRDHTTVLHACRAVKDLREKDGTIDSEYLNLVRILSS